MAAQGVSKATVAQALVDGVHEAAERPNHHMLAATRAGLRVDLKLRRYDEAWTRLNFVDVTISHELTPTEKPKP